MEMIIGIDVGIKGGICLLELETNRIIELHVMPIIELPNKVKGRKKVLDEEKLVILFKEWKSKYNIKVVVIEEQFMLTGQSLSSGRFTIEQYGYLVGLGHGFGLKVIRPLAITWLKAYSDVIKEIPNKIELKEDFNTKKRNIEILKKIFPKAEVIPKRCKVEHTGLVDSILIAYSFNYLKDFCTSV